MDIGHILKGFAANDAAYAVQAPNSRDILAVSSSRKEKFMDALADLQAHLQQKQIFNPEFVAIKEQLNWGLEQAYTSLVYNPYLRWHWAQRDAQHGENYNWTKHDDYENLSDVCSSHLALSGVKSRLKKAAKIKGDYKNHSFFADAVAFLKEAAVLVDQVEALKPFVQKGRRPLAANERKTALRTLENTGTCPACAHNVKLDGAQNLVLHGYQRPGRGYTIGNCVCVGFPPIELSPKGLDHVIEIYTRTHAGYVKELATIKALRNKTFQITKKLDNFDPITRKRQTQEVSLVPGTPEHKRYIDIAVMNTENSIRYITADLAALKKARAEWTLRPLPTEPVLGQPQVQA